MTDLRTAAQQALEALTSKYIVNCGAWRVQQDNAIMALREALEQPAQEPVAYWIPKAEQFCIASPTGRPFAKAWEPLYTRPQQRAWVGLTDEEIKDMWDGYMSNYQISLIKEMMAALKEKNT